MIFDPKLRFAQPILARFKQKITENISCIIISSPKELIIYLISKLSGCDWITDALLMELYVLSINSQLRILTELVQRGFDLNRVITVSEQYQNKTVLSDSG